MHVCADVADAGSAPHELPESRKVIAIFFYHFKNQQSSINTDRFHAPHAAAPGVAE